MRDDASTPTPGSRGSDRFELVIALLLGIAATLAAFSSYQGNLLGGDSMKEFAKASVSSDQAGQYWNDGYQIYNVDQVQWVAYVQAKQAGNARLTTYLHDSLMETNMADAVTWYEEQGGEVDSPFEEDEPGNPYHIKEWDTAEELDDDAERQQAKGERLDAWGDKFELDTVVLAIALFMFGLAAVLHVPRVKRMLVAFGLVVCTASVVHMATLGFYFE